MLAGLYLWGPEGFSNVIEDTPASPLLVADSFLVEDAQVIAFTQHLARFQASCSVHEVPRFWAQMRHVIPTAGRWFPRAELRLVKGERQLALRLRPAPALSNAVQLVLSSSPDPRQHPRIKGPDLALLEVWRQGAYAQGGNEATLVSPDGIVLEGLTTSLVWWEGQTLCLPATELPILPSITRQVVSRIAQDLNTKIAYRHLTHEQMHRVPVWALNALHGIRPVVELVGHHGPAPQHPDLALWQRHYRHQQRCQI